MQKFSEKLCSRKKNEQIDFSHQLARLATAEFFPKKIAKKSTFEKFSKCFKTLRKFRFGKQRKNRFSYQFTVIKAWFQVGKSRRRP